MRRWGAAFAAILSLFSHPAIGAEPSLVTAVKAIYLVKFAHYVKWPDAIMADGAAPLLICIVGQDPFGSALNRAASGDHVDQHPIVVRRLHPTDNVQGCHIAYFAADAATQAPLQSDSASGLTVTDAAATKVRGMVYFQVNDGHVGFHIDDRRAARSNLQISSRLLAIALSVSSRENRR